MFIEKKGQIRVAVIVVAIVVIILAIVVFKPFSFLVEKLDFFRFNFNKTQESVKGLEILRYDISEGKVQHHNGEKWVDFEREEVKLGDMKIVYKATKKNFEDYLSDEFFLDRFSANANIVKFTGENDFSKEVFASFVIRGRGDIVISPITYLGTTNINYRLFYRTVDGIFEWSILERGLLNVDKWYRTSDLSADCISDLGSFTGIEFGKKDFSGIKLNELDILCFKLEEVDKCVRSGSVNCANNIEREPTYDRDNVELTDSQAISLSQKYVSFTLPGLRTHELENKIYYVAEGKVYDSERNVFSKKGFYGFLINSFGETARAWRENHLFDPIKFDDKFYVCADFIGDKYLVVDLTKKFEEWRRCR